MRQLLDFFPASLLRRAPPASVWMSVLAFPCLVQFASAQNYKPAAGDVGIRLGAAGVLFDSSADFAVAGLEQPDADLEISDALTGSLEVEYYFLPNFSASLTVGLPPEAQIDGIGTLAPVGRLADVRYGLASVLGKYHFDLGRVQPFVGAGLAYFTAFDVDSVGVGDLNVDDSLGPAFQVGVDVMLTDRIGTFASVSHAFLDTEGSGTFVGLPISADIELDPTVIQGGLFIRF